MLTQADVDAAAELERLRGIEERAHELVKEKLDMARKAMETASRSGSVLGAAMWAKESDRLQESAVEIAGVLGLSELPDVWEIYE